MYIGLNLSIWERQAVKQQCKLLLKVAIVFTNSKDVQTLLSIFSKWVSQLHGSLFTVTPNSFSSLFLAMDFGRGILVLPLTTILKVFSYVLCVSKFLTSHSFAVGRQVPTDLSRHLGASYASSVLMVWKYVLMTAGEITGLISVPCIFLPVILLAISYHLLETQCILFARCSEQLLGSCE